jgi:hypothetical protein
MLPRSPAHAGLALQMREKKKRGPFGPRSKLEDASFSLQ